MCAAGDKMLIYLAGLASRIHCIFGKREKGVTPQEKMDIYLAGEHPIKNGGHAVSTDVMILESYYYAKSNKYITALIPTFRKFLLDSGAFTFMQGQGGGVNWDTYISQYAEFILANNVTQFFELDIDSVVGLREVERLRDKLETLTNRRCIPVWHKARGKEYWVQMTRDYDYVAIGGIVSGEIKKDDYKYFPALIKIAHGNGAKVHGLGFTQLQGLMRYKFDSVDSTAWLYGNRSGFVQRFNGNTLIKISAPKGMKMRSRETSLFNFNEWVKFQKYAEEYL